MKSGKNASEISNLKSQVGKKDKALKTRDKQIASKNVALKEKDNQIQSLMKQLEGFQKGGTQGLGGIKNFMK